MLKFHRFNSRFGFEPAEKLGLQNYKLNVMVKQYYLNKSEYWAGPHPSVLASSQQNHGVDEGSTWKPVKQILAILSLYSAEEK